MEQRVNRTLKRFGEDGIVQIADRIRSDGDSPQLLFVRDRQKVCIDQLLRGSVAVEDGSLNDTADRASARNGWQN